MSTSKNLPKGQMKSDDGYTRGTLHAHLHVRPPADVVVPHFRACAVSSAKTVRAQHRCRPSAALRVLNSRRSDFAKTHAR